jgi:uncharacterized protein YodC (DUF2158 family)
MHRETRRILWTPPRNRPPLLEERMIEIKKGDVVLGPEIDGHRQRMTVEQVRTDGYVACLWFTGETLNENTFLYDDLYPAAPQVVP